MHKSIKKYYNFDKNIEKTFSLSLIRKRKHVFYLFIFMNHGALTSTVTLPRLENNCLNHFSVCRVHTLHTVWQHTFMQLLGACQK